MGRHVVELELGNSLLLDKIDAIVGPNWATVQLLRLALDLIAALSLELPVCMFVAWRILAAF